MTRHVRGDSRRVAAAALVAAATPLAMIVPSASATASTTTSAAASTTSATAAVPVSRQYVAVSRSGSTFRLQLVDRRSGAVLRTLSSAKAVAGESPFLDADLAADGSVYAVVASPRRPQVGFGSPLVRYRASRATTLAQYVTSVEASPDGRTLAVMVDSPDGDGDGKGLEALRLLSTSGRVVRTLDSFAFPVDKKTGTPLYETGGRQVQGWVGSSMIALRTGCCSESDLHLVRADRATRPTTWPTFEGQDEAMAIGTRGSSALVVRPVYKEYAPNSYVRAGLEVAWLNTKRPKGQIVQRLTGQNLEVTTSAATLNRRHGATPLYTAPGTLPYKGSGRVILSAL